MTLATTQQCLDQIGHINGWSFLDRHKLLLSSVGNRHDIMYRGKRLFSTSMGSFFPFGFQIKNKNKLNLANPENDIKTDLFYHWITSFKEYNSYENLRNKILDRASCASFATTIAVNQYIIQHSLSEKQIVELFKGSPWQWGYIHNTWIQKTLYNEEYTLIETRIETRKIILNIAMLGNEFCLGYKINTICSFRQYLENKVRAIDEQLDNAPRELASYSTRATSVFSFKKSPKKLFHTFLGVELELDGHSLKEYTSLDILQNHAIFKRDGSVPLGVEICTAPATLDVHKEEFLPFFESLQTKKSKLKANENCGMHVHVDRASLSTLHIANIYQFVNKAENRENITNIAGRQPNNFCRAHITGYDHFTNNGSRERYRMVNLEPENTIEFRLFASTTNYNDFCKKLEFVQAVVDYTRPGEMNIPVTKIPLWEHFNVYLKQYRKKYPMLTNFLYGEKPKYVSGF